MADRFNKNPIYVETDYDNIILIDPNKVVINNEVKDRLVDHEELVFYANLETRVIPRTKLAIGESLDSPVVNTTVASLKGTVSDPSTIINFLQPLDRKKFDSSWTDQLSGKGSRQGGGVNQISETVSNVNGSDRFVRNVNNYSDTQLLGIESIRVTSQGFGITDVEISLVDVQGRTLFEQGEKSIYSVFFNLPYPMFYLTLKGYYGKAIRYALNLTNFSATFDQENGNYNISLKFLGKLTGLLSDTLLDYAKTAPKMFPTTIQTVNQTPASANSTITSTNSSIGRQKLDEVYKIYKSKGLIAETFPHLTIEEFVMRVENFDSNMKANIKKGDFAVLNDVNAYRNIIDELQTTVFTNVLKSYLDTINYIVYDGEIYYAFKNNIDFTTREKVINDVRAEINGAKENLKANASFGDGGSFIIGDTTYEDQTIPVDFSFNDVVITEFDYTVLTDDDYRKTLEAKIGRVATSEEIFVFKSQITKDFELFTKRLNKSTNTFENVLPTVFKYGEKKIGDTDYKNNSFLWKLTKILSNLKTQQEKIETEFSEQLAILLINSDTGLGFTPTIRNMFAIIMAGVDTFYRLLDRTHVDAWGKKNDPKRITSIIPPDKNFSIEAKNVVNYDGTLNDRNLVYPWPTYFTLEKQTDGRQLYTVQYLGDPKYASLTNAFDYSIWPEIFFTEEYLEASIRKIPLTNRNLYTNTALLTNYASCNSMEFPFTTQPYSNPSEVSFFYEFYERLFLSSHYTDIFRGDYKTQQIDKFIADIEAANIVNVCKENPELLEKLKNIKFNLQTLEAYLESISNGASENWAKFREDIFVTDYIVNLVEKDFGLYSTDTIDGLSISVDTAIPLVQKMIDYLKSNETTKYTYLNTFPFNESFGFNASDNYDTTQSVIFLDDKKTLATLNENADGKKLTMFYSEFYNRLKNYNNIVFVTPTTNTPIVDKNTLLQYINETLNPKNAIISVDALLYDSTYSGNVDTLQATTILNSPLFINALLDGIEKEKNGINTNPYVALGYVYLSSVIGPEKTTFKRIIDENGEVITTIAAALSKYSSISQIPYSYILYIGAIWHRYKTWIESNKTEDFLDDIWKNFDYAKYYDPLNNDLTKEYLIKDYTGGTLSFKSYENITVPPANTQTIEKLNLGFYPKVINDLHWYFTKTDLFTNYDETEFTNAYNSGKLKIGTNPQSSFINLPGQDLTNPTKGTIINSFFQYFVFDNDPLVDKSNKIYVPIPSVGGIPFNQTVFECFDNKKEKEKVKDNKSVYNGSVRSIWGMPNFGYLNLNALTNGKPTPKDYPNELGLNSDDITDLFGVFNYEMLNEFETAFLGFCKPNPDSSDLLILQGERTTPSYTDTNKIKNIKQRRLRDQILNLFKVKEDSLTIVGSQDQDSINISQSQFTNVNRSIESFLKFDVVFKNGNPRNFNRKLFYNFSDDTTLQPATVIPYEPYVLNSLPGSGQSTTLLLSQANNFDAWKALELYVGFADIYKIKYSDSGSTITDFFIDMNIRFSTENVVSLSPIIKIYATQKHKALSEGKSFGKNEFYQGYNEFLKGQNQLMSEMVIEVSSYLNTNLPLTKTIVEQTRSKIEGIITKLSTYNTFQAFNDKWIAGSDLTTRTLFEDFLFQDPSNTDIGNDFQIDVVAISEILKGDSNISILDVVGFIMKAAGDTLFFALPSYINFYGNNSPVKDSEPKNIDVPNSLFGTYTEVNYLDSRPKFLIVYVGKTSEHPQQKDNAFVFYGDDSYDFRNPTTNPIRVSPTSTYNYSLSNKVVGFNVDFGIRNQNMFKGIQVGMDDKKVTAGTFLVRDQLANGVNGDKIAQQTTSMYSLYQSQSYTCTVSSMGNCMIQPMMYFNLRHVPMFYGPYLIGKVTHNISSDKFETSFEGTRMPKYALPKPDVIATYIKTNYLEKYQQDILETKNPNTIIEEVNTTLDEDPNVGPTISPESECELLVDPKYQTLPFVDLQRTPITYSEFANKVLALPNYNKYVAITVFTIAVTRLSNGFETNIMQPINNNPFEITPINILPNNPIFSGEMVCTSVKDTNVPLFSFKSMDEPIKFTYDEYYVMLPYLTELKNLNAANTEQEQYEKAIAQLVIASKDTGYIYGDPNASPPIPPKTALEVRDFTLVNIDNDRILDATYEGYIGAARIGFTLFS
jgi:hypothetical protein